MANGGFHRASTFTIASSAARTATANFTSGGSSSNGFVPPKGMNGVRVYIDATAKSSTPSVVFTIEVKIPGTSNWVSLLASAAVTDVAQISLEVSPGASVVANRSTGANIGKGFRVTATAGDSDSLTYSVRGEWLP